MLSCFLLQEDSFSLEFCTISDLKAISESPLLAEAIGSDGYVLQERIIVPPHLACNAAGFSTQAIAPMKCNAPLIFIGHPELPVQYISVIAKAKKGKATIEKYDAAIKLTAEGLKLLFSAPIFSASNKAAHRFYSAFKRINGVLSDCHMKESAIARTWIFMEDILRDYELFNKAREQFFKKRFFPVNHLIPASTGIQGRIINNEVLSIEFCAFSGKRLSIRQQFSPLQSEPTAS